MTARSLLFGIAILLALVTGPPAGTQEPEELDPVPLSATIVYRDGRPAEEIRILLSGDVVWVAAQDLAAMFRAVRFWRSDIRKLTFQVDGRELAVTVGSEVAMIDDAEVIHLDGAVEYQEGRIYVPLSLFQDSGGRPLAWLSQPVVWRPESRRLEVGGDPPKLREVRLVGPDRLDIVLDDPREYRVVSTSRARFTLRIAGVTFDRDSLDLPAGNENFLALTLNAVPEGVEVSFAAAESVLAYEVVRHVDPHRVSIFLSADERDVIDGRMEPFGSGSPGAGLDIRTVVIDPGHGGRDNGGGSEGGLRESDLVLGLAREVAGRLEALGIHAVLTRDGDASLSEEERTESANRAGADLFLSLHFDSWPSPGVRGPRAIVARIGGADGTATGPFYNLGFENWGESQRNQVGRARVLADRLVSELSGVLDGPARGVEEWPLPLLTAATMPAVYLEIDVMTASNFDDRFGGGNIQSRIAGAIVAAIERYRREMP